jgi:uncharacterized membrane protein YdjX (TVP38/TMEM64 family)
MAGPHIPLELGRPRIRQSPTAMSTRWRHVALIAIIIVALSGLWRVVASSDLLGLFEDSQRLVTWAREYGPWAAMVIIVLQIGQVVLAPVPGQIVGVAAGYLFGALWGTFYSVLGTAAGSWIAIALARAYGRPLVERLVARETLARLDAGAQRRGLFFFALVFLLPFLPDDLACFAAGLTPIPIPALVAVTITARTPGILVTAWLGANARGLSTAQWVMLIAASALLAGLMLLYGERLQQWLMTRMAGEHHSTNPRRPSHEV